MFSCKMKAFFCWLPLVLVFADDFHRTPPMGWSSWNTFFSEIDEEKVLGIADSIKRLKLDEFGYVYLTIDDFWNLPERDAVTGQMLVNKLENVIDLSLCYVQLSSVRHLLESVVKRLLTPLIRLLEHVYCSEKPLASVLKPNCLFPIH